MSRIRRSLVMVLGIALLAMTANRAAAIVVMVPSASRIPFSADYPAEAREQVQAALETENGKFIQGHSTLHLTTVDLVGNTTAINHLLQNLASCPGVTVTVSFQELKHRCDWRIVHTVKTNDFRVIVNLASNQIDLQDLAVPPTKGPALAPASRPQSSER